VQKASTSLDLRKLWKSETAEVLVTRWNRARHPAERSVLIESASIEFVRRGSYARRTADGEFLVDVNHVAFFNADEAPRFTHPCGDCNAGLTVRVSPEILTLALAGIDTERATGHRLFPLPFAMTSPRCHLLQNLLVGVLYRHQKLADALAVQEMLVALVREAMGSLYRPAIGSNFAKSSAKRVATIRHHLLEHWAERLTLAELARVAGCSVWHLCSIFRAEVGLSVHAYIKRLRLRHALEFIDNDEANLTRLALECGFSSHSHFTSAFKREFGTTPSSMRLARQALE
jgi:AraC-like DNA-binding protein